MKQELIKTIKIIEKEHKSLLKKRDKGNYITDENNPDYWSNEKESNLLRTEGYIYGLKRALKILETTQ